MIGITLLCIGLVSVIVFCWMVVASYFGNMFATFITVVLIAIICVSLNSIVNEPTLEYERQRRDKGR